MKRIDLIPFIKVNGIRRDKLSNPIVDEIIRYDALDAQNVDVIVLHQTVNKFLHKVCEKLNKCNRMYDRFLVKEVNWLQQDINVQETIQQGGPGRPRKSWEELGERSKRQRVADLTHHETEALAFAAA
jgi:hypothetical protein